MKQIDARKLSCPAPVLATKEAVESEHPEINYKMDYLTSIGELKNLIDLVNEKLHYITEPTLIIQADEDPVVDPKSADIIYETIASNIKEKINFSITSSNKNFFTKIKNDIENGIAKITINREKKLNALNAQVLKELKDSEPYVLGIPKRRLYNFGTDANDVPISPEYADSTKTKKKSKGQRTSFPTLRDTGVLYKSFKLVSEGSAIDFRVPNNKKTMGLTEHYGDNELFGFSPKDEEQIFKLFIKPALDDLIEGDGIIDNIF